MICFEAKSSCRHVSPFFCTTHSHTAIFYFGPHAKQGHHSVRNTLDYFSQTKVTSAGVKSAHVGHILGVAVSLFPSLNRFEWKMLSLFTACVTVSLHSQLSVVVVVVSAFLPPHC